MQKNKKVSEYTSELKTLSKDYQTKYELSGKEFATITGISESVVTFVKNLHQVKDELTELQSYKGRIQYANLHRPALFLLKVDNPCDTEDAKDNHVASD
ncbi:hypothetical protein [Fodinibius saliphilus]|uniref:hypothetical protein n=1 Tax=Fodinibius saliphilus TaxID=1920650 RepID=UPI0011096510|nr:hypothetical protein [Fodinibius saliphilus]